MSLSATETPNSKLSPNSAITSDSGKPLGRMTVEAPSPTPPSPPPFPHGNGAVPSTPMVGPNGDDDGRHDPRMVRKAMNQEEFDRIYKYRKPIHKYNEFTRRSIKFMRTYWKPFTSPRLFGKTILSFFPILDWGREYNWRTDLLADVLGGFTLSVIHIPQGIAYSLLVGVPPVVGLYVSFFAPLFYMFFATARHNSLGSFAVVSLMARLSVDEFSTLPLINRGLNGSELAAAITDIEATGKHLYEPLVVASTLTFAVGMVHFIMAFFRLETITTYFSDSIVSGFSTAAACHVFVTQWTDWFGIKKTPQRSGAFNLIMKVYDIALQVPYTTNPYTLSCGIFCVLFLVGGKNYLNPWINRRVKLNSPPPYELLLIIIVTAASTFFNFHKRFGVRIVGELPAGFVSMLLKNAFRMPTPKLPEFELVPKLIPSAISICIVIAAVHISLAKMFGKKLNYKTDSGQELYALGFTGMLGSFFPVFPFSCSLGRTVVNVGAGSKTQLAALFSCGIMIAMILYFGQLLNELPMCVLSTIIMVALTNMLVKVGELKHLWPLSKYDFCIWLVSFLVPVIWDVTEGLGVAIAFALLTTVFRTQWPRWHYLANLKGTQDFRNAAQYTNVTEWKRICMFRFDSPLLFTNVEYFKKSLHKSALRWRENQALTEIRVQTPPMKRNAQTVIPTMETKEKSMTSEGYYHFIIDCSGFTYLDTMGVNALKEIYGEFRQQNTIVYFAAAKAPVRDLFERCGFHAYVPKNNFYPTIQDALTIARRRRDHMGFEYHEESTKVFDPLNPVD